MMKVNLNITWAAMLLCCLACEEQSITEAGNLVPKTVDQDASLPSIVINGTMLHSETYGDSTDPMVVFLHGGPGSDYCNGLNIKELANDGYFVIFYDQRGSGLSERQSMGTYTIQLMLDDLTALIEYYRTSEEQQVFLFGHSWGAMLSAAYINEYPQRIDGVIFAEAGGFNKKLLDEYGESSRKFELFNEAAMDLFYLDQFVSGGENDHEILDYKLGIISSYSYSESGTEGIEGPSPIYRMGAVVLNSFIEIAEDEGFDFTENLYQYEPTALFIYGANNESYGLKFAEKEAAFLPNTHIVEIPDTGHEMIYFKWDEVHPVVLSYLNSFK